ncbi:MAG: OmpA family protein [Gemmatimonadota bacterium]
MNGSIVRPRVLSLALLVAPLAACQHVGSQEFNDTVADLRSEMSAQDQRIASNADGVSALQSDVAGLRQALDELRNDFQVKVEELEDGLHFATPVRFDFDSHDIRAEDQALLDRFAAVVSKYYAGATVTVEGFADPVGPESYNLRLSQMRADAVASYLTENGGLDPALVKTVGYGESRLVEPGAGGPDAGLDNRRVTFVVDRV